jgi:hypothetical protein
MHVFAIRRPGRRLALFGVLTGLMASAALAGCQYARPVSAGSAEISLPPSADVDGVLVSMPLQAPELGGPALEAGSIWTAPPLADYAFERIEPTLERPAATADAGELAPADEEPAPAPTPNAGKLVDVGIASTYGVGDGFQGRPTACGQRFDTNVPQVAHKSLPCGTTVRVEDTTTGRSVVARVTDRGPYVKGRVVDLSWAAFSQLQQRSPGLLNVRVYVVGPTAV